MFAYITKRYKGIVSAGLLAVGAAASASTEFNLTAIAPGVYVHHGQHLAVDDPGREDIANLSVVVGDRCVAVIDTGGSVAVGRRFKAAIRALTPLPICYVINTHVHFDHLLGNAAFVDPATTFVGHHALGEAVAANQEFFAENFAAELRDAEATTKLVGPSLMVEETAELDLGGRSLKLQSWPTAHSSQDLSVYDTASGTLFLGDLLFMERVPTMDGSLKGWLGVLSQLGALSAERVVPGHGPLQAAWPDALAPEERYLTRILNETRAAIAAGVALDRASQEVARDEQQQWLLFDRVHGRNVTRAYTELEWE